MWPEDPHLRRAALELYGAVWSRLPAGIERARSWGGDGFADSTRVLSPDADLKRNLQPTVFC